MVLSVGGTVIAAACRADGVDNNGDDSDDSDSSTLPLGEGIGISASGSSTSTSAVGADGSTGGAPTSFMFSPSISRSVIFFFKRRSVKK